MKLHVLAIILFYIVSFHRILLTYIAMPCSQAMLLPIFEFNFE